MLKPLIKYTGGKYKEYEKIKDYFPENINNYYEPFFGGGGVYFRLHNCGKINGWKHINDLSESLIDFYKSISLSDFKDELLKVSNSWDTVRSFSESFYEKYGDRFKRLMLIDKDEQFINEDIINFITESLKECAMDFHGFSVVKRIEKSLTDKLNRFRKKDIEDGDDPTFKCITTSICQGFYFTIRDLYNDWNNRGNKDKYSITERSAHWFFIREYCFGSMFRFGPNGDFNIPYGGFSYNNKCFSCKIENVISEECINLFKKTEINCEDFESVIKRWNYTDDDFMFLDPPYDSTFSEYDDNGFTREDHERLEKVLSECKCKWLMVIGKTDFISELYKDYNVVEYDKTYMYQARGEYDNKQTTHLLITNYPITMMNK